MKYLRIIILILIFCNLPSFFLAKSSAALGQIFSYSLFLLIIVYYFINDNKKLVVPFIVLGLLFFIISIMVSTQYSDTYLVTLFKYFIFIIMGAAVVKDTTKEEMYIILILGCLSILYEFMFIEGIGGRYMGVYLNPNTAGYACILAYSLSFSIDNKKLKIFGQILFSIAGFVTFSRTFLIIWILINLFSLFINYRNVYKVIIGVTLFSLVLSLGSRFDLSAKRLNAFSGILEGKVNDDLKAESRDKTWAHYYDKILTNPVFGNGYQSFSGEIIGRENTKFTARIGVHNTFLMIIGEAGFFVLLCFMWINGVFLITGIRLFGQNPLIFLVSFSLIMYMLTNHNYFENYFELFVSLWLYFQVESWKNADDKATNWKLNFLNKSI
jgi:hypothetical protein